MEPQTPPVTTQPAPMPTPVPTPMPVVPVNDKKKMPKWLKVVSVVVIVVIVAVATIFVLVNEATKAPQKISDRFVNDLQSGDTSAAYALTSSAFQATTTQDQLDTTFKQVSPLLQGQEKVTGRKIETSTGTPTTAILVYTVPTSGGDKYIKVELQQNGGVWQVIFFRSSETLLDTTAE
jgi:hypothetical protein